MVKDHTKVNEELMTVAKGMGQHVPDKLDKKHQKEFDKFNAMSGAEFDKAYMDRMVKDHEKDIKDAQGIASKAKDSEFKAAVQKAIPVMQQHLELAQRLAKGAAAGSSTKK